MYANIFDNADQTLSVAQPTVRFNQFGSPDAVLAGGVVATAASLTVPVAGDYAVLWQTVYLPIAGQQDCAFGIFVNGTLQNSTRSGERSAVDQQLDTSSSLAILSLNVNDMLELRALIPEDSTQDNIILSARIQYPPFFGAADQPINSASLRIIRLGLS
ncbi:hypothetical protein [Paenibacillus solanacearum]|uniref:hypothetical protein n=1 Tax=Paenibacillus solanacearum TaxID=2048548 RepID=UPI001C401FCD|nr:hypothetical protein [Paenibacillus solanacearum]